MAQKLMLKGIGMDSMEILYYQRQEKRKKAYEAKKRKSNLKKEIFSRKSRKEQKPDDFSMVLRKAI